MKHPNASIYIPPELRELPQWLRWKLQRNAAGKPTKVPDRSTRTAELWTFEKAAQADANDASRGLGFCFTGGVDTPKGRLLAIDLDACRDPETGVVSDWADSIINQLQRSFTEITPSGCGLRTWTFVASPPGHLRRAKVPVDQPAAPNVPPGKSVEFQIFGYGVPQFVTVTGVHLPGTSGEILTLPSLQPFLDAHNVEEGVETDTSQLPPGHGQAPSFAEIQRRVSVAPHGQELIQGDWRAVLGDTEGDRSASAAYYRLVQHVVRAANGHGDRALSFLIASTAWGRGEIEDSADPSKYARPSWVAAEVVRVARKSQTVGAGVFNDGRDWSRWRPPDRTGPDTSGLLVPLHEFIADDDPDLFLVYNVLPRCGLAELFGDPGCGKTPFAISLAMHVAGGREEWFGHELDRHGPVIYMVGEDATGIRFRCKAELALLGLDAEATPIAVSTRPGMLTDGADVERWRRAVVELHPAPALLVVDTLSRNFGPGDESGTQDMTQFVDNAQRLADALGCLVLLVHHTGHANKERSRGSSVLKGALDASYEIVRSGKLTVTASSRKAKNWADPPPLAGTLIVSVIGKDRKGREITAVCLSDSPPDPAAVFGTQPDEAGQLLLTIREIENVPTAQSALAERLACTRDQLRTRLEAATRLGHIEITSSGRGRGKSTYRLTPAGVAISESYWGSRSPITDPELLDLLGEGGPQLAPIDDGGDVNA